jgi:hypothetical protein
VGYLAVLSEFDEQGMVGVERAKRVNGLTDDREAKIERRD